MCNYLVTVIITIFKKNHIPKLRAGLIFSNRGLVKLIMDPLCNQEKNNMAHLYLLTLKDAINYNIFSIKSTLQYKQ